MPDAKVVAGVNVDQAKATPFGNYVLTQIQASQDKGLQELIANTGFDPTRDVHELLVASNSATPETHTGIILARGTFDPTRIGALAAKGGGTTLSYNGASIIQDPKKLNGVAFLSSSLVVAGDLASVKAAIDRQRVSSSSISSSLAVQIGQWSTSQDAWAISTEPLANLTPPAGAPNIPGLNGQGPLQTIQQAAGGVKFGNNVVFTAQLQSDTMKNAQQLGDTIKLLASLAQMQAAKDPNAAALVQSLQVTSSGNAVNVSVSLPQDQFQQILKAGPKKIEPRRIERK